MKLPEWSVRPIMQAHDSLHEVDRVLRLSMRGLSLLATHVPLVKAVEEMLREDGQPLTPESQQRVALAQAEAEFSRKEIGGGFPVLHAHATVAMWGVLEAEVEDVVLAHLEHDPACLNHPAFANVRIPLSEYEQLEKRERLRLLLSEYMRSSKADLKLGVGRFETVLGPAGLAGAVTDGVKRDILEQQQVRNVLVHRAGLADRRLLHHCPWLGVAADTPVRVSHAQYCKYLRAVQSYSVELMARMLVRAGCSREEAMVRLGVDGGGEADASGASSSPDPSGDMVPDGR